MKTLENIGPTIKSLRKEKHKTLVELSKETHLSKSYLSDIENDKRTPDLEVITNICNALNTDPAIVLLKAKVEANLPMEKHRLIIEFAPLLLKLEKLIEELYDDDDDDDNNGKSNVEIKEDLREETPCL